MADSSVAVTPGTGANIDTDTVTSGGDHMQVIKPAWGAAGTRNLPDTPTPLPTQSVPYVTSDGMSNHYRTSSTTNAVNVKASAGMLYGIDATNTNASVRYLRIYNSASAPTLGSGTPIYAIAIPAGAGIARSFPQGIYCSAGIGFTLSTGAADNDTNNVAADEIKLNLQYK